jgi:transposase
MTSPATFQMIEAVAEPFEGAPAQIHRRWSDAFKTEIAAESLIPGAKVSDIARRVGVDASQIYQWRKAAVRAGWISPAPSPSPVAAKALPTPEVRIPTIEISLGGAMIRCEAGFDEAHLRRVIRAVRQS